MIPGKKNQARTICGSKRREGIIKLLQEVCSLCPERAPHALRRFVFTEATGEATPELMEAYQGARNGARGSLEEGHQKGGHRWVKR